MLTDNYIEPYVDAKWLPVLINDSKVIMLSETEAAFMDAFKANYSPDRGVFCSGYWSAGAGVDEVTGVYTSDRVRVRFYLKEGEL